MIFCALVSWGLLKFWIYELMFFIILECSQPLSLNIAFVPFFCASEILIMPILELLSIMLFLLFFPFSYLWALIWIFSPDMFNSSQILSLAISNPLLNVPISFSPQIMYFSIQESPFKSLYGLQFSGEISQPFRHLFFSFIFLKILIIVIFYNL